MTVSRDAIGPAVSISLPGGWRGLRDEQIAVDLVQRALDAHEAGSGEVLKCDHRSLVTANAVAGTDLVVKEVRKGGARRRLADVIRGAPALRAFRAGRRLLEQGIGVARPLAAVERRTLGVPVRSLLVSLDLRDEPTAKALLTQQPETRPQALSALVDLLLALHRCGVEHGDLRAQHVHLAASGPERLYARLIDIESVRFRTTLSDAQRLSAVAQLLGTIPDELAPRGERRAAFERYAATLPLAATPSEAWQEVVHLSSGEVTP